MPIAEALYERIVAAKIFIDENYHEAINLDEISQKAFLFRYHFHRLFSQQLVFNDATKGRYVINDSTINSHSLRFIFE